MDDFMAARSQMALSLGFHIIFSCIGMVMPFFMAIAHFYWLKTGNVLYLNVTKAWSRGVAIFFATGAVSGTVLSFELGLLWPEFMKHAGPIFGMPFSLEGTAFFVEAIALGFYLYGWKKLNKWFHWVTGVIVGVSGLLSGILVVAANSWMNDPTGFRYVNGRFLDIDPIKAMWNPSWFPQALHMCLAAFVATGFAVAGIHALMILKKKDVLFHTKAFKIAVVFGGIAALLQPISGDHSARNVARSQPAKLAAMEVVFKTQKHAPLLIGGIPDTKTKKVSHGIELPGVLSFMAYRNVHAEVKGLDAFPDEDQPPVAIVHYAFQVMVAIGMAMFLLAIVYFIGALSKQKWRNSKFLLSCFVCCTPLGFMAVEAGWIVTEVGRQPWIIQGIMRTKDAVTPMPGITYSFYIFSALYISLAIIVCFLLYRQIKMVSKNFYTVE